MSVFQRSLDDIGNYYGFTDVMTGLLVTGHFMGIFLAPLLAGELADKYGRRIIVCAGFSLFFIGIILSVASRNIVLSVTAITLVGGGFGIIEGMITALLVDINEGKESIIINLSQAFFCLGALVGPLITSALISVGYTWRNLYVFFAVTSLFYTLYIWKLQLRVREIRAGGEIIKGTIVLHLFKKPVFMFLALSMFMYVGIEQGVAFWITSHINTMTDSIYIPSIILSAFWGLMILGRITFGLLSGKINNIKIIIGLTLFSLISLIFIITGRNYVFSGVGYALLGIGFSAIWPLIMALTNKFFGNHTATGFGVMMACSALGGMLIPFIAGAVGDMFNIRTGIAVFFGPLFIILLSQYMILRKTKGMSGITNYMSANTINE